jgi:hypothetical protein
MRAQTKTVVHEWKAGDVAECMQHRRIFRDGQERSDFSFHPLRIIEMRGCQLADGVEMALCCFLDAISPRTEWALLPLASLRPVAKRSEILSKLSIASILQRRSARLERSEASTEAKRAELDGLVTRTVRLISEPSA